MLISMEIPYENLWDLSEHTDFDFALYHLVTSLPFNHEYNRFYRNQSKLNRMVWLDTSYHELKECPTVDDMVDAARVINATHIVCPEVKEDHERTLEFAKEMRSKTSKRVVCPWQGDAYDARVIHDQGFAVALPFDRDRETVLQTEFFKTRRPIVHLFGFNTLQELMLHPVYSIDTSMPIRAAQQGYDLLKWNTREDTSFLNYETPVSKHDRDEVIRNIALMRHYAALGAKG